MAGLTKEQRAALMADGAEDADPIDLPVDDDSKKDPKPRPPLTEPKIVPPPPEAPPPPPPQPPDTNALIAAFTAALTQSSKEAAQAARNPIPETYLTGGFPEKSVFSHPDGDLAHPRTILKCPMFIGIYDDEGVTHRAFEIMEASCTEKERVLLNQLVPGTFPVERNDGVTAKWKVVLQSDDLGTPVRLIIAMPAQWLTKEHQAANPGQPSFLRQLTQPAA